MFELLPKNGRVPFVRGDYSKNRVSMKIGWEDFDTVELHFHHNSYHPFLN